MLVGSTSCFSYQGERMILHTNNVRCEMGVCYPDTVDLCLKQCCGSGSNLDPYSATLQNIFFDDIFLLINSFHIYF